MRLLQSITVFLVFFAICYSKETTRNDKITAFANWVDDNNFQKNFDLILIPGQGIGGVANKDITEGDFLVRVPISKMLFAGDYRDINGWNGWGEVGASAEPLMLKVLLEDSNPTSEWKPYIDILPELSSFSSHILMWSEKDFEFATQTALLDHRVRSENALKKSYKRLQETLLTEQPELFPEGYFTWEKYLWSYLVVTTRAWSINERNGDLALVPLADMLNHNPGYGQGGLNYGRDHFLINTTKVYQKGDQVYDSYGPKTNYDLLSTYGFLLENNPDNGGVLEYKLNTDTNLVHKIIEPLLKEENPNYNKISVKLNKVPHDLLRIFRIASLEFSELDLLGELLRYKPVSLENERKAFRSAIEALKRVVASYPTEEDENALLSRADISDNGRNAIRLRMGEKEVFQTAIQTIRTLWNNILLDGELMGGVKP